MCGGEEYEHEHEDGGDRDVEVDGRLEAKASVCRWVRRTLGYFRRLEYC